MKPSRTQEAIFVKITATYLGEGPITRETLRNLDVVVTANSPDVSGKGKPEKVEIQGKKIEKTIKILLEVPAEDAEDAEDLDLAFDVTYNPAEFTEVSVEALLPPACE